MKTTRNKLLTKTSVEPKWMRFIHKEAIEMGCNPEDANAKTVEEVVDDMLDEDLIDWDAPTIIQESFLSIPMGIKDKTSVAMSPGNISMIKGVSKAKKSYFVNMVIAALTGDKTIDGFLIPNLPEDKKGVMLIDTEQAKFHVQKRAHIIKHMGGDLVKERLFVYGVAGRGLENIRSLVSKLINDSEGVGVIVIDQIADLVNSINSENEAIDLVNMLTQLATGANIHIIVVTHNNKGGEKAAAGWLGTHLLKKCETVFNVEKITNSLSTIEGEFPRNGPFDKFALEIDDDGYPTLKEYEDIHFADN